MTKSKKAGTATENIIKQKPEKLTTKKTKQEKNIQGKVPHDGVEWSSLQDTLKLPF